MIEITNEQKEQMASFWGSMITNEPQEFVVKEKYDELQQEIERLNNIINTFDTFIEEVYNHINLGDESDDFMLVLNKWLELKGDSSNE